MKRCMGCMEEYKDDVFICPYCGYEENTLPEESFHLTPGTVIGKRYQIGRVLGFGGFGVTYIGFDLLLEKKIAVKEYLPSEFATRMPSQTNVSVYSEEKTEQFELGMNKFMEEAKKLAKFNETSEIVNVYDCLTENNTAYIVMEYLEGESLKSYLEKKGKLSLEETEAIILPILRSLQSIHEAGLIHRDIAPDNIFLTKDGRVKLLDFGAARYASATHSRSLSVIYKPGYAPEEQYQSRGMQGPWTDVYALGATMYKMMTGITPDTSIERRAKDSLKPPSKLGVAISKNKETALLNAMNVQHKNRTQSTKQFLEEWESQGTVIRLIDTIKRADVGKLSKKAKIAILASIVAVGAIAAAVLSLGGFKKIAASINVQEGKTRVPSVVNATQEDALERLSEAGLGMEITGQEFSAEIKKGMILSQETSGGSLITKGTKLGVVMSGGILQIYMPSVEGKKQEVAAVALETAGFEVTVESEYNSVVAPGNVIRTSIPVNTQCDDGTAVVIYVSKGIDPSTITEPEKKYTVEDFTGKTLEEVHSILAENGIYLDSSTQKYDDVIPKGTILSQETAAGTELSVGETVCVTVSLGKQMVRIPDLKFSDMETANTMIQELLVKQGLPEDALVLLCWETVYHPTMKEGLIIEQYIGEEVALEGMEVEKGTVLYVTVSKGPEPVATATPKPKATNAPTATPKPTATNTPKPTATNTPTATPKPTATNTPRPTATNTPTPRPTVTPEPAHEHNYYWEYSVVVQATCTSDGHVRHTCSCGEYWEEKLRATGHKEVVVSGTAATCTATGLTDGKQCSVCGEMTTPQQTIAMLPHTEVTVAGTVATCMASGLTDGKKCSVCGTITVAQQTIAAKGHAEVVVAGWAANCTNTGMTDGKKCSVCGTTTVAQQTIPAKGHTRTAVAGTAATCTNIGWTAGEHCYVCNTVLVAQNQIPATGHTRTVVAGTAPTCTNVGWTAGEHCYVCNTVLVPQNQIPATGHSYVDSKDLNCNTCNYARGYWTDWIDNGTAAVAETSTRSVKTENVAVTVYKYRYSRCVWYSSSGVYSSSKLPPSGYTETTSSVYKGSKTYRVDYSSYYDTAIPVEWVYYNGSSTATSTYDCSGTIYYNEIVSESTVNETHYFYRDAIYY